MQPHPIETTNYLRETYKRYLKTINPFLDESLRTKFWEQLDESERLVKGPLLEASSPFKNGDSIEQLIIDGILHTGFRRLCDSTPNDPKPPLPLTRPLYLHQERAITNVTKRGRNLVVATGTGSGKTESFLIPILNHLLQEEENGTLRKPGVRALLLYPMNALANDQMARLRSLLKNYPSITFGRYTGESIETPKSAREKFQNRSPKERLLDNEYHSREEMRKSPPHILLTNYAMLEYLLLRPEDTSLFDGETSQHWRFLVVDEAHVYDGANGIEVAMLLRRLKDRIVQSVPGRLTCIATSATIGKGKPDFPEVAEFAQNLFGESFDIDDIFEAERQPIEDLGAVWGEGTKQLYESLVPARIEKPTEIAQIMRQQNVPYELIDQIQQASNRAAALYILLQGDNRLRLLHSILSQRPILLSEAAQQLFPDEDQKSAEEAAIALVDLAVEASPDGNSLPILPARYHVFARATEGVFVCVNHTKHTDGKLRMYLNRHEKCTECEAHVFEVATCRNCGTAYIVGEIIDNKIISLKGDIASGQGAKRVYFAWIDKLSDVNEDEMSETEENQSIQWIPYELCTQCGKVWESGEQACQCRATIHKIYQAPFDSKNEEQMHCAACSTRSKGIIFRLLTGQDAPIGVLATALYTELPPSDEPEMQELPGQGRKLLLFSDSRQDAAFSAPYLERTFNNVLQRRLIYQSLQANKDVQSGEYNLNDLVIPLLKQTENAGWFDHNMTPSARRAAMRSWLMREIISWTSQQSLERLGLLHFFLPRPKDWYPPVILLGPPWNLGIDEVWTLICLLVDTLRNAAIISVPDGVDIQDELFQPLNRTSYIQTFSKPSKQYQIRGWVPKQRSNARLDLLEKVLRQTNSALHADEVRNIAKSTLENLWEHHFVSTDSSIRRDLLKFVRLGADNGYQLNYESWRWYPCTNETVLWRCTRCHNIAYHSLRGICMTYGCSGKLEQVHLTELQGEENHYRYLYHHLQPAALNVQEHTAQWKSEEAQKIQSDFIDGKVNVLTCSTTFELGVDVGSLQAVLMRNMPPTTANYLQRAGRAGRRRNSAAYIVTFAQRRSHDLAYYRKPENMVAGKVSTPSIVLSNPKIVQRHMHSVLLAAFWRWCADIHKRFRERKEMKAGPFFEPSGSSPTGPELLKEYLQSPPIHVLQSLQRIVPQELQTELNIKNWEWLPRLTNAQSTGDFDRTVERVLDDVNLYGDLINQELESIKQRQSDQVGQKRLTLYMRVLKTIRERDLINLLAQQSVLPKYGFPVDVVELRTDHVLDELANKLELQRDLRIAISEYAPGGQIVAGKKVFTARGIYRQPKKDLEPVYFAECKNCKRFNVAKGKDHPTQCKACSSGLSYDTNWISGTYIKPEFGFIADQSVGEPSDSRPPRLYSSKVFFDDYRTPSEEELTPSAHTDLLPELSISNRQVQISTRYSRYGQLVIVNHGTNGRGFNICSFCGYAEAVPEAKPEKAPKKRSGTATQNRPAHKNPRSGKDCTGYFEQRRLGHDFITDVLEIKIEGAIFSQMHKPEGKDLWRSILYALLEGASQGLGIRRSDLNGTLYPYDHSTQALLLYDDVPGGAGHVRRIKDALPEVFQVALDRIKDCQCGPETACHECLWNYYNQPYHDYLSRGLAIEFLERVLQK